MSWSSQVHSEPTNFQLLVSNSAESTALSAAKGLANSIRAAVQARGQCTLALSGGSSPKGLLAALAKEQLPWQSVHIFQVDERAAPAGSPDRNWTSLQAMLLDHIEIPTNNIHVMPADDDDLQGAAKRYAAKLTAVAGPQPVIDIVHLGLGGDGHTASLIPGDPVLGETESDVAVSGKFQGYQRLTLTYPCLRRARQLVWFVIGANKAAMLEKLLQADQRIPAGRLGHDRNVVYADQLAAPDQPDAQCSPVLSIDVGGSHVKFMDSVNRERRQFESGKKLSAEEMCKQVLGLVTDWDYGAVSIGIPAPVRNGRPLSNPPNLGSGWVDFDYASCFGQPLKIMNDAAMQALGSYQGDKMLFLGLGTGLGAAMITQHMIAPFELAHLPYRKNKTYEDYVGEQGLERLGKDKWRKHVERVVDLWRNALLPDYVVLGGGNVRHFEVLPSGCRRGDNDDAFKGGFRLWQSDYLEF